MSNQYGRVYSRPESKYLWIEFKGPDVKKLRQSSKTADHDEALRVLETEFKRLHATTFHQSGEPAPQSDILIEFMSEAGVDDGSKPAVPLVPDTLPIASELRIQLPGGITMHITGEYDPKSLAQLIRYLVM